MEGSLLSVVSVCSAGCSPLAATAAAHRRRQSPPPLPPSHAVSPLLGHSPAPVLLQLAVLLALLGCLLHDAGHSGSPTLPRWRVQAAAQLPPPAALNLTQLRCVGGCVWGGGGVLQSICCAAAAADTWVAN